MVTFYEVVGFVVTITSVVVGIHMWQERRVLEILRGWAVKNDFEIISYGWRPFCGPFFWAMFGKRGKLIVYFVNLRDRQGSQRSGWVSCGRWLFGISDEEAVIAWKRI
jgi:hypothetical protein